MSDLTNLARPNGFSVKKTSTGLDAIEFGPMCAMSGMTLGLMDCQTKMKHYPVRRRSSQTQCVKALGEKTKIIAMCCSRGSKCAKAKDV